MLVYRSVHVQAFFHHLWDVVHSSHLHGVFKIAKMPRCWSTWSWSPVSCQPGSRDLKKQLPFGCIKNTCTLQGTNISHLGKRKIIFKMPFLGDMLVPWRVYIKPRIMGYPTPKFNRKRPLKSSRNPIGIRSFENHHFFRVFAVKLWWCKSTNLNWWVELNPDFLVAKLNSCSFFRANQLGIA